MKAVTRVRWLLSLVLLMMWGAIAPPSSLADGARGALPEMTLPVDGVDTFALTLDAGGSSVVAVDLVINWDPHVMRVDVAILGELAQGWAMATNLSVPGELRVAMSAMQPQTGSGALLDITATALGTAGDFTALTITKLALNDGAIPCSLTHGQVTVGDDQPSSQVHLPLVIGWNLLSLPYLPSSIAIEDVLAPIEGNYDLVLAYDAASVDDPWQSYSPSVHAYANDLRELVPGQGVWIRALADTTLAVEGTLWEGERALATGWNLIGYWGESAADVDQALSSLNSSYDVVHGFDASEQLSPWAVYSPTVDPVYNTLLELEPGGGYWILMNEPGVMRLQP